MRVRGRCARPLLVTVSFVLAACGGDSGGTSPDPNDAIASVTVSPATVSVNIAETVQLSATVRNGRGEAVSATVTWSSSAPSVASVSPTGLVTGTGLGSATVTATSEGRSGPATVTVEILGDDPFVLIPAGSFQMGSTNGNPNEQPVHTVNITQPFYVQTTEVTQGQWRKVMGSSPSFFDSCGDDCPVEQVSWDDIQEFLSRLNAAYPERDYRLPTEAEWEYAARAGTTGDYGGSGNLDEMGWYENNSDGTTHPAAQKLPNAWGLYDMHGNVWELVQDWYSSSYYSTSPTTDPPGPTTGTARVMCGGSWGGSVLYVRSASRGYSYPSTQSGSVGFRLARTRSR